MFAFSKNHFKRGFTIIELLVVIAVVGVVFAMVLLSYVNVDREMVLERSAVKMVQDVRAALGMALSASILEGNGNGFRGGYGVFFPEGENYYIIFADTGNTGIYNEGSDKDIKKVYFEDREGTEITEVSFSGTCIPVANSITFLPPDPEIFIGDPNDPENCIEMKITIEHRDLPEKIRKISLNKVGRMEIEK